MKSLLPKTEPDLSKPYAYKLWAGKSPSGSFDVYWYEEFKVLTDGSLLSKYKSYEFSKKSRDAEVKRRYRCHLAALKPATWYP